MRKKTQLITWPAISIKKKTGKIHVNHFIHNVKNIILGGEGAIQDRSFSCY